jgi:uncharacterized membrane protein SpoIIM required for sporulation
MRYERGFNFMNEIRFLHKNKKRWEEFEQLMSHGYKANPDRVSDLYIHLTDDLAYARTYFPDAKTTAYLNQLTQNAHRIIYRNQPVKKGRIAAFWRYEFPLLVYSARKEVLISFLIIFTSALIGLISNRYDTDFVRIILGDSYVNITQTNIEKGDPLAIYKIMDQVDMFLLISRRNITVSFLAFVCGTFTAFGTGLILLYNGIMLGTFQGFLAQKGLLLESLSTIWIHGTLEIFAIIVAGAAGIIMGNSIVFPGSFTRLQSFRMGAVKGIKMVIGLVPVFMIAAFLEGFITRYTQTPYVLKFSIIGLSLFGIIFYFFLYPRRLNLNNQYNGKHTH